MSTTEIDDLKQFITAMFSQQFALFRDEMDQRFNDQNAAIADTIADAIENVHAVNESYFKDHEKRITKLEQKFS